MNPHGLTEECGYSYDHDLTEGDSVDGIVTAECRRCGAELTWEAE